MHTRARHQGIGRAGKPRGFTLFELVIVGATITVLSAIAIPRWGNSIANYRASLIARRVAADISLAQARARAASANQRVVFDIAANQYQLPEFTDPDRPSGLYTVSLTDPTLSGVLVSASFGGSPTLTMNGYGLPAAAGTIQIRSGTVTRVVTVNADTGAVTIQ
jgi:Tfp pilus assembly protein FimT